MAWQLNGVALSTSTVEVLVEPGVARGDPLRIARKPTLPTSKRIHLGSNIPEVTLRFRFTGPADDRQERLDYVRGILKNGVPWVLKNDDTGNEHRWLNNKQIAVLATNGVGQEYREGVTTTVLTVQADYLGVPLTEGGDYLETVLFETTFIDNDFFTATDDADYLGSLFVGFPPQTDKLRVIVHDDLTTAYINPSLSLTARGDGASGNIGLYDLTNYVVGDPHSNGDGGPAVVLEETS